MCQSAANEGPAESRTARIVLSTVTVRRQHQSSHQLLAFHNSLFLFPITLHQHTCQLRVHDATRQEATGSVTRSRPFTCVHRQVKVFQARARHEKHLIHLESCDALPAPVTRSVSANERYLGTDNTQSPTLHARNKQVLANTSSSE